MSDRTYSSNEARAIFTAGAVYGAYFGLVGTFIYTSLRINADRKRLIEQTRVIEADIAEVSERAKRFRDAMREQGASALSADEAEELLGRIKF